MVFRASGLASGIDTASIVDQLVALKRAPIDKLQQKSRVIDVQVSSYGSLRSQLAALKESLKGLSQDGARAVVASSTPSTASVKLGADASVGRFSIEVEQLAQAAKGRSGAFGSGVAVAGSIVTIGADGASYDVPIADGASLAEAAQAINDSDAPVTAAVVFDGTNSFLSVSRKETGHAVGSAPATALTLTEVVTGGGGQALGLATTVAAKNAVVHIDGLRVERRDNVVSGAIPGAALTLQRTGAAEDLVVAEDGAGSKANLEKVLDAYNAIVGSLQSELAVKPDTDRSKTLAGEPTLRRLQGRLQSIVSELAGGSSDAARSLADLGVKSARDGKLSIDAAAFDRALAKDPRNVDKVIDGVFSKMDKIDRDFGDNISGAFKLRTDSLSSTKKDITLQIEQLERRTDAYKEQLLAQFAAMEKVVSTLKATGNFLTSQENRNKGGNS